MGRQNRCENPGSGLYSSRLYNEKKLLGIPEVSQLTDHGKKLEYETIAVTYARKFGVNAWRKKPASYGGAAWISESGYRVIDVPEPDTLNGLYTWLHESAHHYYNHMKGNEPYHREEMQADSKALEILKAHGIALPPKILHEVQWNVCQAAKVDEKQRVKIDSNVAAYCEGVRV
jgi:hypothetical protein